MKYWRIAEIGACGGRGKMTMLGFALLTPTYAGSLPDYDFIVRDFFAFSYVSFTLKQAQ
jgi:hypothetical protein